MKVLTCNNIPICISEDENLLKKRKESIINRIIDDSNFEILSINENEISYYTGISYCKDIYEISDIEVLEDNIISQSREEEIKEASKIIANGMVSSENFVRGAKWADSHPYKGLVNIRKIVNFIHMTFTETISGNVISRTNTTIDKVIEDLQTIK